MTDLAPSMAGLNGQVLIATEGQGSWLREIDQEGCPGTAIDSYAGVGPFGASADTAAILQGPAYMLAGPYDSSVLNAHGVFLGSCLLDGNVVGVRYLAMAPDGTGFGAGLGAPVYTVSASIQPYACNLTPLELSPSPYRILGMAHELKGAGFLTLEQDADQGAVALARYDSTGHRNARGLTGEPHLVNEWCSGAVVEVAAGIFASVCGRALQFDPDTLKPIAEANVWGYAEAVASTGYDDRVIVAVAYSTESGAEARFAVVQLY